MISRPAVVTGLWQILILFTPNITILSKEICLNNIANVPMDWVWAVKGSQSQIGLLGSKTQSLFSNIPFIVLTVCASFSLAACVYAFQPLVPTLRSYGSLHSLFENLLSYKNLVLEARNETFRDSGSETGTENGTKHGLCIPQAVSLPHCVSLSSKLAQICPGLR